ncbi:MAG: 2OG-Fe(II) oxygenase [Novosphingobium sp.]
MPPPPDPNNTAVRAETLAGQGRIEQAYRLLEAAVAKGDGLAALTLADWRMAGALIRRDLAEARRLYGLAAEFGTDEAEPVAIALLANGAGGSGRNWGEALAMLNRRAAHDPLARQQAALIGAMALDGEGNPRGETPEREIVHVAPRIERLPAFLTRDECRYLAELALPRLAPSVVFDPRTGEQRQDPVRTAHSTGFPFVVEDPVLHAINRRIAAATATQTEQGEPLQVLSYRPGQEYKLHSDALPGGDNQRVATFLVTLSEGFSGGATSFPRLGLELTGKPGDGLFFVNTDNTGQAESAMWHAGLPVSQGRKLMLSKWIREKPLDLSGPPGRPF